jgi:hypothetical protein
MHTAKAKISFSCRLQKEIVEHNTASKKYWLLMYASAAVS